MTQWVASFTVHCIRARDMAGLEVAPANDVDTFVRRCHSVRAASLCALLFTRPHHSPCTLEHPLHCSPQLRFSMVSQDIVDLCTSEETLTRAVANTPSKSISKVAKELYKHTGHLKRLKNSLNSKDIVDELAPTKEDLDTAVKCGRFPHRPSDLFLKVSPLVPRCTFPFLLATVFGDRPGGVLNDRGHA